MRYHFTSTRMVKFFKIFNGQYQNVSKELEEGEPFCIGGNNV